MATKEDVMLNQLNKYCKLSENEKVIVIDEKIISKESLFYIPYSSWGKKQEKRIAMARLMHWEKKIENYKRKINRELTVEDVKALQKSMESYQRITGNIEGGWGYAPVQIKKTDILEVLVSDTKSELFELIEFKKKGYIREKNPIGLLYNKHVVTVIECEEYLTIKEVYIPYSGIVIQLPTE